jgi:glycosyltransferase involved in cell wall biosynthesis
MNLFQVFKGWLKWSLSDLFYSGIPRRKPKELSSQSGVNLVGYIQAEMGLGEALRNTARALSNERIPFLVRTLDIKLLNRQENYSLDNYTRNYCDNPINLIGINPDLLYRIPSWLNYEEWTGRYNVGYWFWELENFPKPWRYARHIVDEVWVNTEFVANSVRQIHPNVYKIPFAVEFDSPRSCFNRDYFGLPPSDFIFLFSYDFNSSEVRKNPGAVIEAFQRAFRDSSEKVSLVVKSINGEANQQALKKLKSSLCDDFRIKWVDGYLTTDEMRGLLNMVNVYVSLHRSEGLGLGMAESMYLGKPVIATDYSGNREFMNPDNSCMIPYTLVPVNAGEYPYHEGQYWADPNIDIAATWMKRLVNEPDLSAKIGARASEYMRSKHSLSVMGSAILDRVKAIRQRSV